MKSLIIPVAPPATRSECLHPVCTLKGTSKNLKGKSLAPVRTLIKHLSLFVGNFNAKGEFFRSLSEGKVLLGLMG